MLAQTRPVHAQEYRRAPALTAVEWRGRRQYLGTGPITCWLLVQFTTSSRGLNTLAADTENYSSVMRLTLRNNSVSCSTHDAVISIFYFYCIRRHMLGGMHAFICSAAYACHDSLDNVKCQLRKYVDNTVVFRHVDLIISSKMEITC